MSKEKKGKRKIWMIIMIVFIFMLFTFSINIMISYWTDSTTSNEEVYISILWICVSLIILTLIGILLLARFYYKARLLHRDKLVENEEGRIIVVKYDKELEKKVDESIKKVDNTMKE